MARFEYTKTDRRVLRLLWRIVYLYLFRFSPTPFFGYRRAVLRLFGASIGKGVHVYPTAVVWFPKNLIMDDYSCLGPNVDCYNVATVHVGAAAIISQYAHLCTASHDYTKTSRPLVSSPIRIETRAWVASGAFIGPGVTIGENSVILARAVITRNVSANQVWQSANALFKCNITKS